MREQIRGFQLSIVVHAMLLAGLWAISMSAVMVSRPIEIYFDMVREYAQKDVKQARQVRKERMRTAERPRVFEQEPVPSVSENAVPVPASKPAESAEQKGGSVKNVAMGARRPLETVSFGSATGPHFLNQAMPVYPFAAKRMNKEGRVVLCLTIDETGRLLNAEVLEGAGFGFTEAALDAVRKSTYRPARRDGAAVLSRAVLSIRFELKTMN